MSIQAVIFDLGGVLLRTEDKTPRTRLAESLGKTYKELDQVVFGSRSAELAAVGEMDVEEHWQELGRTLELSEEGMMEFQRAFWEGDRLDRELIDYLRSLRPHYTTALLSNAWSDLRSILEEWKITDAFDEIIISAEVGMAKPDTRIYELIVEKLGIQPEQGIFVDDFSKNVEAARAAGLHAIHFQNREQTLNELQELLSEQA